MELEKMSLDESSYESIYEDAEAQIQKAAPWWTHREASDPGVTLLEMWAVLADMQSFYLNQVQEAHYRKYLKLLGIRRQEGACACAWVSFEGVKEDITLPRGTKLTADRTVFETEKEARLTSNSLCGFRNGRDKNKMDIMSLSRKTGFSLDRGELLFSFSLKKPLKAGERLEIFVLLDESGGRNPLGKDFPEQDFFLVQLSWEYRTRAGWRAARIVKDETRGLLYSGLLCLQAEEDMVSRGEGMVSQGEEGNEIRCRVIQGSYDVTPVIYKISLNVVKVIQRDTLCAYETAEFTGTAHNVRLQSYLGKTGELRVLRLCPACVEEREAQGQEAPVREAQDQEAQESPVREAKGQAPLPRDSRNRELWQDITGECMVDPPVTAVGRERYVYFPGEGKVRIVCTGSEAVPPYFPCAVSGVAAQKIALPWGNVMREGAELMLQEGEGSGLYVDCRRLQEPDQECCDYAWHFQEDSTIVLGDGRHGDIPPASGKGLLPVSLALWEGSRGNVSIGRIRRWARPELFPELKFTNLLTGSGGTDRLSAKEQFLELTVHKEQLMRQDRMVTEGDIRELAGRTPGLLIDSVEAQWRDGTAAVTVFPVKPLDRHCVEKYKLYIQRHLEQYRLVGSRVRVEIAGEK